MIAERLNAKTKILGAAVAVIRIKGTVPRRSTRSVAPL